MRTLNRLLAPLAALALIALAVLLAIEVVAAGVGAQPVIIHWHGWYDAGRHNVWRSTGPLLISSILVAIGLLLLAVQLIPRRMTDRELEGGDSDVDAVLSSSGVRSSLKGAAHAVDGIATVKIKLVRKKVTVTATTHGSVDGQAAEIREQVSAAVRSRLDELALRRPPRLTVHVRPGKEA